MLDLLADLEASGIQLQTDGVQLRYRPRQAVSAELAESMRAHKAELMVVVEVRRRIRHQLAQLIPYKTSNGWGWIHPRYHREVEDLGLA